MCGIVGVLTKGKFGLYAGDVKIFVEMLIAGQLRGTHGTGIMFDNKAGVVEVRKAPVDSSEFSKYKNFDSLVDFWGKHSSFLVGHNRWATKGAHVFQNTHPFQEGDITLVHNGTLYSHKALKDVEVDSHAICHSFNTDGVDASLEKMFGAFALVWHDKKTNQVNFLRNNERPLYIIETNRLWVFCSEVEMGEWILTRNKEIIVNKFQLPVGMMHSFNLETRQWAYTEKKFALLPTISQNIGNQVGGTNLFLPPVVSKSKKVSKKSSFKRNGKLNIGDIVSVYCAEIITVQHNQRWYLECFILDDETQKEIECRFYSTNKFILEQALGNGRVFGKIQAEAYIAKTGGSYFVITDVSADIKTANGHYITPDDVDDLGEDCHCCMGALNKSPAQLKNSRLIRKVSMDKSITWDVYCPDCTDYFENHYQGEKVNVH